MSDDVRPKHVSMYKKLGFDPLEDYDGELVAVYTSQSPDGSTWDEVSADYPFYVDLENDRLSNPKDFTYYDLYDAVKHCAESKMIFLNCDDKYKDGVLAFTWTKSKRNQEFIDFLNDTLRDVDFE